MGGENREKDVRIFFSFPISHFPLPILEIASSQAPRNDNVPGGNLPLSNYDL